MMTFLVSRIPTQIPHICHRLQMEARLSVTFFRQEMVLTHNPTFQLPLSERDFVDRLMTSFGGL